MATSGTVSTTQFNTLRVIDHAFRRCRLPAQAITAEMQEYARDSLYLLLSELANVQPPSWCIERQVYPLYRGQPYVPLDLGTVQVLNANYRTPQQLSGLTATTSNSYSIEFEEPTTVAVIGVLWSGTSTSLTLETSTDGVTWNPVGVINMVAQAGQRVWHDLVPTIVSQYLRLSATSTFNFSDIYFGNTPQEIPMGVLNRDTYVAQSNKVYEGRPLTYWFQRDTAQPALNLWPAPDSAAEHAQLIVWRHRHIMDVGALVQDIEVPQRWMEAIIAGLAARVAAETPTVDANLVPALEARASVALSAAWNGDNDGSPIQIQPRIGVYTR